jgi:hypothetical protein
MLLSPAAAPCCGSNTADVAPTIDDEEMMDTRTTFPHDRRNNNERKQTNKLSSCTVEDMCERFVAFCDPLLTVCVPCASASGSSSSSSSKTISKQNKTRNRVAIGNTKRRSRYKTQHDNKSTTAMYNEEEHDRLLSVLRQLGINEHEMTQLLINESDSLQSISRASATAAAAAAAAVAATGRISAHHGNNNNDRNNCGNIGCGGRGSSSIHTMSNNDNDNHQSYNDRILDIGVGDGMLILPRPTKKSVVSYPPHCDDNNDRSDPPGENATTAYMEVECFVDTTTTAKNSNKNMDNNNNNKQLLPLSLSLKKYDNMTNNNTFDDDDDDDVDNDDLGTVISCREIVPKQQSFSETKKTMSSSLPLDDTNPSKLIRGKSYIVNAETLDLVTLPTDESNKIDNNMSLLNNKSNNYTANDVITTDDLVVESTTAAVTVKRKSLISSIFSRKKSLKKESSSLESSTSKQRSSSSSNEWREFTDVTTGRKYYSNGIMSLWENPALYKPMSNATPQKLEKKETKKQRSRSTPPKSSTMTSKPTSSSHLASSSSSSRPRRSKSSPPKQPSASNAPVYSTTTTTNDNTIVETNNDDDDQTLVSKLTFIPDGNVEINDSYFSSIVKGYRLSTQSFHLPPPVQPPHPVSSPIVYGVATPPSKSKIRPSSINTTVPLRKGCTVKNAAINGAAANSSKRKKITTLQVLQHQSKKPTMTTDEVVANVDQSSATRPVIVGMGKSFKSSYIVPSFHNSMKKAAKVDEQKTDIAAAAVVAKSFSQCTKEAPVLTKTADVTVGRPMENSNIQSSNVVGSTYEHFQFVLTECSGCDEHTRLAIDRNNYNTNNMMIRLPYNPNTTFYDLRCELMEDYPNEIAQLLPNDFKFTISSSSTNGLPISNIQEQKWKVREYYDLSTQSGNGSYKNPYQVYIKSNYINSSKANEIAKHEYDSCW